MTRVLPIVAAVLFVLWAPAAQAASPAPPSLTGEAFITSGLPARGLSQATGTCTPSANSSSTFHVEGEASGPKATGTCTPSGNSSYTFHVEGEAIGPYTGTYVEDGSFTIAPITNPVLTAFNSTFTITSPAGT